MNSNLLHFNHFNIQYFFKINYYYQILVKFNHVPHDKQMKSLNYFLKYFPFLIKKLNFF
jgi:hypothetical protein